MQRIALHSEISVFTVFYFFLQTLGSLVEVSMPQNGIYMEGIAVLADAFRNNPNLQVHSCVFSKLRVSFESSDS